MSFVKSVTCTHLREENLFSPNKLKINVTSIIYREILCLVNLKNIIFFSVIYWQWQGINISLNLQNGSNFKIRYPVLNFTEYIKILSCQKNRALLIRGGRVQTYLMPWNSIATRCAKNRSKAIVFWKNTCSPPQLFLRP